MHAQKNKTKAYCGLERTFTQLVNRVVCVMGKYHTFAALES